MANAQDIIDTAESFAERAGAMLATLNLPAAKDHSIFEGLLDQVADELPMGDAEWRLFANTARVEFHGVLASADDRLKWRRDASSAREALLEEAREDEANQAFDHRRKEKQEAA